MTAPLITRGQRATLVGRSGVGKTTLGKWLMFRSPLRWIVLDTKHDDGFNGYKTFNKLPTMKELAHGLPDNKLLVVRPTGGELTQPRVLDNWLAVIHDSWDDIGVMIDEGYQVAMGANAGPGLTGLLTRGRARGQAVIVGSQRPARLPLFCFTEANYFFIMQLSSKDDKKKLYDYTGQRVLLTDVIPPYEFRYFDVARGTLTGYSPVTINKA